MKILENGTMQVEDFILMLEDRAFVDYFNIYLSLPIFGQHVIYNFIEREFSYEPPIRKRKYVDKIEVARWLCNIRFPDFVRSCLFLEYNLCTKIREVDINFNQSEVENSSERTSFTKNVLGNALGMQIFRGSLIGTPGEKCYKCWLDLEKLKLTSNEEERQRLKLYIKNLYIADGSIFELETPGKYFSLEGKLNSEFVPDAELQKELLEYVASGRGVVVVDTDEAFCNLQRIILAALRTYWVPRYLLNISKTMPKKYFTDLKRPTPCDSMALAEQRQMRCRFMFPRIYDSSCSGPSTSPTKALQSSIDGEIREKSEISDPISEDSLFSVEESEKTNMIKPSDFLKVCGGSKLEPTATAITMNQNIPLSRLSRESYSLDFGSAEPRQSVSPPKHASVGKTPSYTDMPAKLSIPPSLATYISGRLRLKKGKKISTKVMFALAAENLAGNPLHSFLEDKGQNTERKMLEFWTNVRLYLDVDETHCDEFGNPIKQYLAHKIFEKYLSSTGESNEMFSESMKMIILNSLSSGDDYSLLCYAQDVVTGSLKDTWKTYMSVDRQHFRSVVRGERLFDRNIVEYPDNVDGDPDDPVFFLNATQGISPEMLFSDYRPKSGSISAQSRPWSRLSDNTVLLSLTDEQIIKAFEFTVILAEYGRTGIFSYQNNTIADIVDVINSDFGTLQINQEPVVRDEFLYNLMNKPKIDIAKIKVSRKVYLDRPLVSLDNEKPRTTRLVLRRDGVVIDRPEKPRTFAEVLSSPVHYEFFKRLMAGHKMPYPLAFWKNIEELKEMSPGRMRQNMINNILRKYFSKSVKHGQLLDCSDDIIRQIPSMEKVPISVLVCAQASVFRSMERKWYPKYLETFSGDPNSEVQEIQSSPSPVQVEENLEIVKPRRIRKRKTLQLWQCFISTIVSFMKAMNDQIEIDVLDYFLRKEICKHPAKSNQEKMDKNFPVTNSTAMFQTRIVLSNRLIIVDKLPMDIKFWCDVAKYVEQIDHIQKLDNISRNNIDFLHEKASNIVKFYLASEIPPSNQLNIPSDLAQSIVATLEKDGPSRSLFHDALLILFPSIYHYWRKCQKQWKGIFSLQEYLRILQKEENDRRKKRKPKQIVEVPDYLRVKFGDIKVTTQHTLDDEHYVMSFSLTEGYRLYVPLPKGMRRSEQKRRSVVGRRTSVLERASQQNLKEGDQNGTPLSPKKEKGKEKEREKAKSRLSKKMDSLAEESGTSFSPNNLSSPKTPDKRKKKSVKIPDNSPKLSPLMKMDQIISEVVQDDIDKDLFGDND